MLTDRAIKSAKPKDRPYRLTDHANMYLVVTPSGSKLFRLDYTIHDKRKTFSLGGYPLTSLKEARLRRDEAKRQIAAGLDPVQHRQMTRAYQKESFETTFKKVGLEWLSKQKEIWSPGHARTVEGRLKLNLFPWLHDRPLAEITAPELLLILRKIENRGAVETAHRCRTVAGQIFRYGIACGICERDPAGDLRGALKPHQQKRMAAITDPEAVGGLIRAIEDYHGDEVTRCGLKISALTFVRPGELRKMLWSEINFLKREWLIPAPKTKMKRAHLVPLADQVIEILQQLHPLTGQGKYVFPSMRTASRPMSENTINSSLRRMGFGKAEMTAHGFRSMASSILHENQFPHEVIELQLAHARRDRVAAAYDRSKLMPQRRAMLQWYADHLDNLAKGESVTETDKIATVVSLK